MLKGKPFIKLTLRRFRKLPQWLRLTAEACFQREKATLSATSMDLCDDPHLQILLGARPRFHSRLRKDAAPTIVGWGRKWSGQRANNIAAHDGKSCLLIEDGFLRSVGRIDPPLSIVCDTQGIYYDATAPSLLETHIATPLSATEEARTHALMDLWRDHGVSKYNDTPRFDGNLPDRYVLVVDQVAGDHSIAAGQAAPADFAAMLQAALDEHPSAVVVVKTHPDLVTHARKGHFDIDSLQANPRIHVVAAACDPVQLLAAARAVYTVTSQMGFEALIRGKPVHCFGMPFYAGWGLTRDAKPAPERRTAATLTQLVHGALIKYARYMDPETQRRCDAEVVVRHIGLQRRMMLNLPDTIHAVGFSTWKQPVVRQFLPGKRIHFSRNMHRIPTDAAIAVWGSRTIAPRTATRSIIRVEDGFLRSSGLGADLVKPLSWAFDDLGVYFDPEKPSRLEQMLQDNAFDAELIARARSLIAMICDSGVSKYNIGAKTWRRPDTEQRVILVPGQVEADASIQMGCPEIKTNIALLRMVRARNPGAFIVYKPHPDVVAGLRRAGAQDEDARQHCDQVITDADPAALLAQVDEVHTMTSLIGFEALLRGISVTCYGQPFYAGWGLTQDTAPIKRRTTKLTIEALVAGALICYPRYVSRISGRLTTPERAIADLADWRRNGPSRMGLNRRILRAALRIWTHSGLKRSA